MSFLFDPWFICKCVVVFSNILGFLKLSFFHVFLVYFDMLWEHTWFDFTYLKFAKVCFMAKLDSGLSYWISRVPLKVHAFCCCWVECSISVSVVNLINSMVQVFCILTDFLSFIWITNREVQVCLSFCLSLSLCVLGGCLITYTHI